MGAHKNYSRPQILEMGAEMVKAQGIKGATRDLQKRYGASDASLYKYKKIYLESLADGSSLPRTAPGDGHPTPENGQAANYTRHALDCLLAIQPFITEHFQSGGQDLVYGNAQSAYLWLLRAQEGSQ